MTIRFNCPQCKKAYKVKDELAGKKASCSACKKVIVIPSPGATAPSPTGNGNGAARTKPPARAKTPTASVEEEAASALSDEPVKEDDAPQPTTIDFKCPFCDDPVRMPLELAGKQSPCPSCSRIVKVPMPVRQDPKDWRKKGGPQRALAAQKDAEPAPEGAWGSTTSRGIVSRGSLEEADAIPQDRPEPWTWWQRIVFGAKVAAVLAAVSIGGIMGLGWWAESKQQEPLDRALVYARGEDGKSRVPDGPTAVLHRAAGEYFLRAGKLKAATGELTRARARLVKPGAPAEQDALLIQLALTQIDLGGTPTEVRDETHIKWEAVQPELRKTLGNLRCAQARAEALRQVTRKLVARRQAHLAFGLAPQLSAGNDFTESEAMAVVGLEFVRLDQRDLAGKLADASLAAQEPPPPVAGATADPVPLAPSLVALCWVLKPDVAAKLRPTNPTGPDSTAWVIGTAEGLARQRKLDDVKKYLGDLPKQNTPPFDRFRALAAVVSSLVEDNQVELARSLLEEHEALLAQTRDVEQGAISAARGDTKGAKANLSWQYYRLACHGSRAEYPPEKVQVLIAAIPDVSLQAWARLELFRARLEGTRKKADLESVEKIGDVQGAAQSFGREFYARHNSRHASSAEVLRQIETWQPDTPLRPAGWAGVALGLQDGRR